MLCDTYTCIILCKSHNLRLFSWHFLGGSSGQSYDYSSTIKASMCGSEKAFSLTSTKDRIWIRFKSNGYINRRGFVAGYVLYDATKTCKFPERQLLLY